MPFFFIFKCVSVVVGAVALRICYINRESLLFKTKFLWHYYTGRVQGIKEGTEPFTLGATDSGIEITNAFFIQTGQKSQKGPLAQIGIKSEHVQKLFRDIVIGNRGTDVLEYENTSSDKLHVHYKYGNQNYRMCLEHLNRPRESMLSKYGSKKNVCDEMTDIVLHRKVIGAFLKKLETVEDVTDIVKMHQGPFHDFHKCIEGSSNKLIDIFHEHDLLKWDYLIIDDLLGDQTIIDINPNSIEHICLDLK